MKAEAIIKLSIELLKDQQMRGAITALASVGRRSAPN